MLFGHKQDTLMGGSYNVPCLTANLLPCRHSICRIEASGVQWKFRIA